MWTGIIGKSRMNSQPTKFNNNSGLRTDIELADDEGIAEDVAFCIDSSLNILAIQTSIIAPNEADFCSYINQIFSPEIAIHPTIILREDAYKNYTEHMKTVTRFELKFATPKSDDLFEDKEIKNISTENLLLQLAKRFGSHDIEINLHNKHGLKRDVVTKFINHFKKKNSDEGYTNKLKATGKEGTSNNKLIDFVNDAFIIESKIEISQDTRELSANQKMNLVKSAWDISIDELTRIFERNQ